MSSKRAIRRRACKGKRRFDTYVAAFAAMRALVLKKGVTWPMNAYGCRFCGGFHFGHAPAAARNRRM